MAPSSTSRNRPVRTIITFIILTLLIPFGILTAGVLTSGGGETTEVGGEDDLDFFLEDDQDHVRFIPATALDLGGGAQIVLQPSGDNVTDEVVAEAIDVIRLRLNAAQLWNVEVEDIGDHQIGVSTANDEDWFVIASVVNNGNFRIRPVLAQDNGWETTIVIPDEDEDEIDDAEEPTETQDAEEGIDDEAIEETEEEPVIPPPPGVSQDLWDTFGEFTCGAGIEALVDDPNISIITCDNWGMTKFILGPEVIGNAEISVARAASQTGFMQDGSEVTFWAVDLYLDEPGTQVLATITTQLAGTEDQLALVMDGAVLDATSFPEPITDGELRTWGDQFTGFTENSARAFAAQLNYGILPTQFTSGTTEDISATLGTTNIQHGLLAGIIGLALGLAFLLWRYRALGLVAVAALAVAGGLAYTALALASWWTGYQLSLADVAALIVG
ncbi:MAG: hypothetical protein FWD83_09215, partial [Promicromonosporaceae bacterium]|nr:hypothetical protein [Promicromonosporaceae bacterium]